MPWTPPPGRRGGGTEVKAGNWCAVRRKPQQRPRPQLPHILYAAADVATDIVGVVAFVVCVAHHGPCQNRVPKTGGEPFDLRIDRRRHICARTMRCMAVCPQRVLSRRRSCRVKRTMLRHQHIGPSRRAPAARRFFGCRDLRQRASQMNSTRAPAYLRPPRHRLAQRVVHLKHARTITKSLQSAPVGRR